MGTVVIERAGVDDADATQQAAALVGTLREAGIATGRPPAGVRPDHGRDRGRIDGSRRAAALVRTGGRQQHGRCPIAQPEARTSNPGRTPVVERFASRPDLALQGRTERLSTGQPARDVVADVGDRRRTRCGGVQRVERGHAIGVRGGHGESLADVVERRLADPADPRLDGVQCRQEFRAARPDRMTAAGSMAVCGGVAPAADPTGVGRPQDGIDGSSLRGRGEGADDVKVHRGRV